MDLDLGKGLYAPKDCAVSLSHILCSRDPDYGLIFGVIIIIPLLAAQRQSIGPRSRVFCRYCHGLSGELATRNRHSPVRLSSSEIWATQAVL